MSKQNNERIIGYKLTCGCDDDGYLDVSYKRYHKRFREFDYCLICGNPVLFTEVLGNNDKTKEESKDDN